MFGEVARACVALASERKSTQRRDRTSRLVPEMETRDIFFIGFSSLVLAVQSPADVQ